MTVTPLTVGGIIKKLSDVSKRPRQALVILNLISEIAGPDGRAGPWVESEGQQLPVRDWLGLQLKPLMDKSNARQKLRARLRAALKDELPPDDQAAEQMIEQAVLEHVLKTNKTTVSRTVTDLEKAGLLTRRYEGYLRPHVNRGAQRHAVYILSAEARAALQRGAQLL